MSLNNTSPTIPVAAPMSIGNAYSVNNVGVKPSVNASKSSLQPSVVYQPNKVNLASMPTTAHTTALFVQEPTQEKSSITATSSSSGVAAVTAAKSVISPATIVTIAQTTKSTTSHTSKPLGKHQLPVRPLPVSAISHVLPRSSSNAVTAAPIDPGGGFAPKTAALSSSIIPAPVKTTKVAAQHVLMAPGLRSPAPPTIKLQPHFPSGTQPFGSVAYHIPNQQPTTSSLGGKPVVSVTTPRIQQPLLVRSIFPQQPARPVTITTTLDGPRRPSSVVYQPTTTISISVPARPSSQHDSGLALSNVSRITVPAPQGGKPVYQVGIAPPSASSLAVSTAKVSRKVVTPRPSAIVPNNSTSRPVSLTTSATSTAVTSVSSFTYSAPPSRLAAISSITTSPVPVTKVYSQPPSAMSHVRTSDYQQVTSTTKQTPASGVTTAQSTTSVATVVTSLATSRNVGPILPHMVYWSGHPGINLNPSYAAPTPTSYSSLPSGIRLPVTSPSPNVPGAQIRINPLLVMDAPRVAGSPVNVAAFTQGQTVLQTITSTQPTNNEQTRLLPAHLNASQSAILPQQPPHVANMSPKPAILRRPVRADASISKKLNFTSEPRERPSPLKAAEHRSSALDASTNVIPSKGRYSSSELVYTHGGSIKPALSGQVTFTKQIVTSNGLGPGVKLQNNGNAKDYSVGTLIKSEQGIGHITRHIHQVGDQKVKSEPNYTGVPFTVKTEPVSQMSHQYHAGFPSQANKSQDGANQPRAIIHPHSQPPASKVRLQPRGLVTVANPAGRGSSSLVQRSGDNSPSVVASGQQMRPSSGLTHAFRTADGHADAKIKLSAGGGPPGALKRSYDSRNLPQESHAVGMIGAEQLGPHGAARAGQQSPIGLSPRKKPRKQTHIIAEELPDAEQIIDEEMSTDDADECEDEQPLPVAPAPESKNAVKDKVGTIKLPSRSEEDSAKVKSDAPPASAPTKTPTEFTDQDGVRYVTVRARPPFSLLNGHRARPVTNHFNHYSDVKVKEKKITFHDQSFNSSHLNGWKVSHLAAQLDDLMSLDADALKRIERIKDDLLEYCRALLNGEGMCETGCKSPAAQKMSLPPSGISSTPTQSLNLSTSFAKHFQACAPDTANSPLTPTERRATRFREEILKIEEMAQANIQRCSVMQEQLSEAKSVFVKVLDSRDLATKLVDAGREIQKPSKSVSSSASRSSKKKKS